MHPRVVLCTALLSLTGTALAAGTPQGTSITNSATLTYRDALNQSRSAASNIVTVQVRQVYVATVTPDADEGSVPAGRQLSTYAGGTRLFPYTLRNDGNGTDSFSLSFTQSTLDNYDPTLRVYRDLDGDGNFTDEVTSPLSLAVDTSVALMVAATIPTGTPVGQSAQFALVATSVGDPTVSDTNNYAQLNVTADGTINLTKSVSPSSPANPGDTLTYTISGTVPSGNPVGGVTNVVTVDGTPRTGVLITDVLSGLNFGAVSVASATHGSVTPLYSTDSGVTWTASNPGSGVNAVGLLVTGSGAFLLGGDALTLQFTATVPATTLAGVHLTNTATATFDGNGDGTSTPPGETVTTPPTDTTVATVVSAAVGPYSFPQAGATGTYTLHGVTIARSGDTQSTSTNVVAGGSVDFRQTLRNTGNASNTFVLTVTGAPPTWTCTVQNIDGSDILSPLTNPVTVAALSNFEFAVHCDLPYSAAGSSNVALTVTATPTGGSADTTTSSVANVTAAGLPLLGNSDGDATTAPTTTGVTVGAAPGTSALFPLELINRGPVAEAYDLTSSVAGTTFYLDVNGNGQIDPGDTVVSTTAALNPAQTIFLIAQVPVAPGSPTGSSSATFTATSTLDTTRLTSVTDTLRVNAVASGTFAANSSLNTISGGTVTHSHTLSNTGNGAADFALPAITGSSYVYAFSVSASGPFSSTLSGTLAAGASTPVYVRVTAPTLASTATSSDTQTVQATLTMQDVPQPFVTLSVQDTTNVQSVVGTVNKSVLHCTDATCATTSVITDGKVSPGEYLQYTLQVVNGGTSTLYGPLLNDALPTNTTFVKLTGGTSILFSIDSGTTWSATPPVTLSGSNDFLAGLDTNGDNQISDLDTLAPGAGFTVTFVVRVN